MNTLAPRLETAIRQCLSPLLRDDGFAGSGRTFRRKVGKWIQVVNVQGSRYGGSFAVNLAFHPLPFPDVLGNEPNPKSITQELCEFRRRMSESEQREDKWWKHENTPESMTEAVLAAADTYARFGRVMLNQVTSETADLNTITPANFATGAYDFKGFGGTECRMALVLARLRRAEGKHNESKEFASYGLQHAGSATALRKDLEALLTENDA